MMSTMIRAALGGNLSQAKELHYKLLPLMNINFIESNPIPVKAALAMMGLIEENYRLPLVRMTPAYRDRLAKVVEEVGLLAACGPGIAARRRLATKRDKESFESLLCFLCLFVANFLRVIQAVQPQARRGLYPRVCHPCRRLRSGGLPAQRRRR